MFLQPVTQRSSSIKPHTNSLTQIWMTTDTISQQASQNGVISMKK